MPKARSRATRPHPWGNAKRRVKASRRVTVQAHKHEMTSSVGHTRGNIVPAYSRPLPYPEKRVVNLRYAQQVSLVGGAVGLFGVRQRFSLNSIFDPDITGAGHQPYGFDQMATIYARYKVLACDVTFKPIFMLPAANDAIALGCLVTGPSTTANSITTIATVERAAETQMCSVKYFNTNNRAFKKWSQHFGIADVMGVTVSQFTTDLDNTTAPVTGSPGNICAIEWAVLSVAGGTGGTLIFQIELNYKIEFYERVVLAQS